MSARTEGYEPGRAADPDARTQDDVAAALARIVDDRRRRLPAARARVENWLAASEILAALAALPAELAAATEIERAALELRSPTLGRELAEVVESFRAVVRRFSRETVTIAASGEARVGKSTLLQSITGLGDGQLPASTGSRVTAARIVVFHSPAAQRATLTLHSFESFRQHVLRPYHVGLNILPVPASPEEFAHYRYPEVTDLANEERGGHRQAALLRRLRDMQDSFGSYRELLRGTEQDIALSDVRGYVTYPPASQEAAGGASRPYLAVRELRVHTPFPHARVDRLAVVDLPGLGEVSAEAHIHHMEALRDDVDLVLLVKRAGQGLALWREEDEQNLDLLDEARGPITARRDYVFLLINGSTEDDPRLLDTVRTEIGRGANLGSSEAAFTVVEADVRDPRLVFDRVLRPVLDHLASRLPVMDADVAASAQATGTLLSRRVVDQVNQLGAAVTAATRDTASVRTELDRRAERLRLDISRDLVALTRRFRSRAEDPEDVDEGFRDVVERVHADLEQWAATGMGAGDRERWEAKVADEMQGDEQSSGVAASRFGAARIRVARGYATIDDYLNNVNLAGLLDEITAILARHLGPLLVPTAGDADALPGQAASASHRSLDHLATTLEELPEACPTLAVAVRELSRLRFEFRSMVYPHIRGELDLLRQEAWNPASDQYEPQILVSQDEDGARQMYDFISRRTRQVAYRIRNTVLDGAARPAPVLLAATEIFADTLIRSPQASEEEFRTLAHAYGDEIWPGEYGGLDAANARVARLRTLLRETQDMFGRLAQ
ncbi:P-loop NTPase family protein [Candidatus Frankia nodulisporulans]|uniref:hypothetical protein n=1 Tax=Candidatus Frankia nodulisporulans TaxID=2060052 RepID=UPI0013D43D72|nr:hypothetical protein [Candidatus Frankia nodulisporulans]